MENVGQPQTVQVPNYSGVNIQIFNPSVAAPGAMIPASNINTTNYNTMPSYPQNYYTQNLAQPQPQPQYQSQPIQAAPVIAPEKKKTEKREIVELTDDYIKNLENYLNSQNPKVRLMGAKEVLLRLQEDESRKDDSALTALNNKMLQDPSAPVRFLAMAALESRAVTGDNLSVKLLKNIAQQKTGYGEDALKASNILLKMSGNTLEKEFEVKKDKPQIIREIIREKTVKKESKEK